MTLIRNYLKYSRQNRTDGFVLRAWSIRFFDLSLISKVLLLSCVHNVIYITIVSKPLYGFSFTSRDLFSTGTRDVFIYIYHGRT